MLDASNARNDIARERLCLLVWGHELVYFLFGLASVLSDLLEVKNVFKGTLPRVQDPEHSLYMLIFPPSVPPKTNQQVLQPEATVLMPPNTFIWRSPKHGTWEVHVPPHRRYTQTWLKHGSEPYDAMLDCVRHAWRTYFEDHGGIPESHCPIKGVFV